MEQPRKLSEQCSVMGQLYPEAVEGVAALGFRSIINNRPDLEAVDQPRAVEVAEAARACGLDYREQPVVSGQLTLEDVETFIALLQDLPGPVLAFCRSGTRCANLWALAQARLGQPVEDILEATGMAGYDLRPLRATLVHLGGSD